MIFWARSIAATSTPRCSTCTAGTIAELGQAAGLTYLPPREPAILGDVWLKILHFRSNRAGPSSLEFYFSS
jgi:hypothetical protein